jgi:hypothetical protein
VKRFVVQEPLRDKAGENIGLIVYASKTAKGSNGEPADTKAAMDMRDALQLQIPSYEALFQPAKWPSVPATSRETPCPTHRGGDRLGSLSTLGGGLC